MRKGKKEYLFRKETERGVTKYYLYIVDQKKETEVSKEIYEVLSRSIWKEDARNDSNAKRCLSLDYRYTTGDTATNDFSPLERDNPELNVSSAEDVFFSEYSRCEFYQQLKEICTPSELELLIAVTIDGITDQAYADQLGLPRSTINSRKLALFKKLKKKFEIISSK